MTPVPSSAVSPPASLHLVQGTRNRLLTRSLRGSTWTSEILQTSLQLNPANRASWRDMKKNFFGTKKTVGAAQSALSQRDRPRRIWVVIIPLQVICGSGINSYDPPSAR